MQALLKTNGFIERWIFLIMPAMMIGGMGMSVPLSRWVGWTPLLFMLLTFLSALNADYRKLSQLGRRPVLLIAFFALIHLAIPWISSLYATLLFRSQPDLAAGMTLASLLPLGVTSIFWVSYNKGNLETALSLVTLNTLLSPLIVPLTISLILGSQVKLDTASLFFSLLKLVLIPTVLGMLVKEWIARLGKAERVWSWGRPGASVLGKLCLCLIVLLNAASIAGQLDAVSGHAARLITSVLGMMALGYALSYAVARLFTADRKTHIALAYAGGVRNYTVGVVLASAFFTPATGLPVLVAMLLQHPLALLVHCAFRRRSRPQATNAAS
ncbi:bile acid:sodium symporter family protein [Paenibacillus ginsengihumi]|uniref:bile acid:sodium symporter family protein n=1 Tax=Paenibacillus ginsengihumi TaxID=431596 RepID=UPI0003782C11|nr:bile acid:sodium symporter [Paenibacillus ginsengihumi]